MIFSECCRFEEEVLSNVSSFCSTVQTQDFVANPDTLNRISGFLESDLETFGLMTAFRCLHCM